MCKDGCVFRFIDLVDARVFIVGIDHDSLCSQWHDSAQHQCGRYQPPIRVFCQAQQCATQWSLSILHDDHAIKNTQKI